MELADLFAGIVPPADETDGVFAAEQIPGWSSYRIACNHLRQPTILISYPQDAAWHPHISLRHLRFVPSAVCDITSLAQSTTEHVALLQCTSEDHTLARLFLTVAGSWIEWLGENPSATMLCESVERFLELFRNLEALGRRAVLGLWGELLVIGAAQDPDFLVRAWHRSPSDTYDFSASACHLEVKTTTSPLRIHHFSLHQLQVPAGASLTIISILVDGSLPGLTLAQLATLVKSRLASSELRFRVDELLYASIGKDWQLATTDTFGAAHALEAMFFYDPSHVPSVDPALPPEVSDVRFAVELNAVRPLPASDLRSRGPLAVAAEPSRQDMVLAAAQA